MAHQLTTSPVSTESSPIPNGTADPHPLFQSPPSQSTPHAHPLPPFPRHVALHHGLSENFCQMDLAFADIDMVSPSYILALRELFGHFGVDLDDPLGTHDVSAEIDRIKATPLEHLLGMDSFPASKRLGPGQLRNTQAEGFEHDVETFNMNQIKSDKLTSLLQHDAKGDDDIHDETYWHPSRGSRGRLLGLRKAPKKNMFVRVLMGTGYAKLGLRGHLVIAWCYLFGKDSAIHLKLAANDIQLLRELCSIAVLWKKVRDAKGNEPSGKDGKFQLFRFMTRGLRGVIEPHWERVDVRSARPKESVILPGSMLDDIIEDVRDFLSVETMEWYKKHGIPQRRSFLFYGPPGCGKTSTINMLAGMFGLNASFLSMTTRDFCNEDLHHAITELPSRPLLVLEDVDVLFTVNRENDTGNSLTFSGLLNALDGLISANGVLSVFTTNHVDKLDAALIRAGRIDRRFEFRTPTEEHIVKLFKSFYPDCADGQAELFSKEIMKRREPEARSIATLQQLFIYTRTSTAAECVDRIGEFFKKFYHDSNTDQFSLYS